MRVYVNDILRLYDVKKKATTPATEHLFTIRNNLALSEDQRQEFHSRVGKLLYPARRVRPELLPMSAFLKTRVQCATED
jgi:hypothetical protein